jgi:hypothetical protein
MSHLGARHVFGLIGLICLAVGAIALHRQGRLQGNRLALAIAGLSVWAIGLALSAAGI